MIAYILLYMLLSCEFGLMPAAARALVSPLVQRVSDARAVRLDPERVAELLHVGKGELARAAGVDRNTPTRSPGNPKLQALLQEVVRVVEKAAAITGDHDRALIWFNHQPLEAYGFKTPRELVFQGHADAVTALLDDMEHGTYA